MLLSSMISYMRKGYLKMTGKWHGGKGSKYRPVDKEKFDNNWDRIFGSKKDDPEDRDLKFTTAEEYMKDGDSIKE